MLLGNTTRRLLSCGLVQNSKIYKFLMRLRIRLQQEKFSATRVLQQQVLLKRWKQHKIWHHWIKATIKHTYSFFPEKNNIGKAVPGSLDKKEGRRFYLLLSKRLHLRPPFLFNEPGTGFWVCVLSRGYVARSGSEDDCKINVVCSYSI
jgi:hypothetical protein